MLMYNLIECSNNHSDTSGSLRQFKRDKLPVTNAGYPENVTTTSSTSFKYQSTILGNAAADGANGKLTDAKIAVPLKYLGNFWRY